MDALRTHQLSKQFIQKNGEPFIAVNNVTMSIEEGKIHGLLGPNGAGKSTLINMITGSCMPSSGEIVVFDNNVTDKTIQSKQVIGIVPQEIVIEMAFTVYEVLYYFSGMYGISYAERNKRIPKILEVLDLSEKAHERARGLSGGMKRRLMIAKAIIHKPKLLILDEPTAGVDVTLRQRIWELVRELNKQGTTVLFTTHYLEEAEQLCERITVLNHGKIVKNGDLKDIQQEFSKNLIRFELFDRNTTHLEEVQQVGMAYNYPIKNLRDDLDRIAAFYKDNLKSIRSEAASLEEIFLNLTSK
ncbi:ABC transporter ATP-binding protein [Candidatus Uhrbacteria bacterium]|nr:ABC transporter ATP-binding protein [Candidatus Uhrbacteria bacterium]